MAGKKRRTRRIMEPHEADEKTPCESCRIDLLILKRAHELTVEQGHATNIVQSLQNEAALEAMWRRPSKRQPFKQKKQKPTP
jgi:hypothetical protein